MKPTLTIQKYMTAMPHTINPHLPIKAAITMMREHSIRHLPVQDAGQLLGIVTDRDIKLAASFTGAKELTVADVMTPDPYTVNLDARIDTVVKEMVEHKYGSVVVQQGNGKVVGIFTAIDGLKALAELLATLPQTTKS